MENYTEETATGMTGASCHEDLMTFSSRVYLYGIPLLVVFGTFGNVLSGLVMLRPKMRRHTTCVYLGVLAVVDTATLYTGLSKYWIIELTGYDIREYSPFVCKFSIFCVYFLVQLEAWILVSVSLERLFAVCAPARANQMISRQFTAVQLIIVTCVIGGTNAHFFWTMTVPGLNVDPDDTCGAKVSYKHFWFYTWPCIDMLVASVLPFIIMLTCSLVIIITLHRRKKRRNNKRPPGTPPVGLKMSGVTAMLLSVCLIFLLCSLPVVVVLIISSYKITTQNFTATGEEIDQCFLNHGVFPVTTMIVYVNNAINFWLYCISGPLFRAELKKMFCFLWKKLKSTLKWRKSHLNSHSNTGS